MTRHIFKIDDGEMHWYSAETPDEALESMAHDFGYASGKAYREDFGPLEVTELPDDLMMTVNSDDFPPMQTTKPCREWAAGMTGCVATTCC